MSNGQRMVQQWIIRVDSVDLGYVGPGQSVQIGRKPLRPLAEEGIMRLEVQDSTRSMSKRHAEFSVDDNGVASIRDLNSTNGTYVIRSDGELMHIPAGTDFLLPNSPVRMQFGDVPVDFIRVERRAEKKLEVPDLFGYAVSATRQEPDAADLSVDDILDLRAGEPTSLFNADQVKNRAEEFDVAQYQSFLPASSTSSSPSSSYSFNDSVVPLNVMPMEQEDNPSRDLFADARVESGEANADDEETVASSPAPAAPSDDSSESDNVSSDLFAAAQSQLETTSTAENNASEEQNEAQEDAESAEESANTESAELAESTESVDNTPQQQSESSDIANNDSAAETANETTAGLFNGVAADDHTQWKDTPTGIAVDLPQNNSTEDNDNNVVSDTGITEKTENPASWQSEQQNHSTDQYSTTQSAEQNTSMSGNERYMFAPLKDSTDAAANTNEPTIESADEPAADKPDYSRYARPRNDAPADAYTPAFEPGSVFERVSKGEFAKAEPTVEVNGLTSDEAKRTSDFTVQFEMARHQQLLPFLAMNPSLYDDLYAWLAAQGDQDIDAALARNEGYQEYRKAVGK